MNRALIRQVYNEYIAKRKDKSKRVDTACGVIVSNTGKHDWEMGKVCHAFLAYTGAIERIAVISGIQDNYKESHGPGKWDDSTEQEKIQFLDWLMNRSPYRSVFMYKGAKTALKNKAVVVHTDVSARLMAGALVSTRRMWEHTHAIIVFSALVKRGVPENLAFLLGHMCSFDKGKLDSTSFSWAGGLSGHCSIDGYKVGKTGCRNFCKGSVVEQGQKYTNYTNYDGYSHFLFGLQHGENMMDLLQTKFPKAKQPVKPANNPFAPVPRASHTFESAMDTMGEWWPEIYKWCGIEIEQKEAA